MELQHDIRHALYIKQGSTFELMEVTYEILCLTHVLSLHQTVVSKLQNLRVWESIGLAGGQEGMELNAAFKTNLRGLLCGG